MRYGAAYGEGRSLYNEDPMVGGPLFDRLFAEPWLRRRLDLDSRRRPNRWKIQVALREAERSIPRDSIGPKAKRLKTNSTLRKNVNQNESMKILKIQTLRRFLWVSLQALVATLTFSIEKAAADTIARVFPLTNQVMITVYRGRLGGSDSDARALFDAMNVPVQDSLLGPGKAIEDSTKALSWVCGDKGKDGVQCTFMFKKSGATRVRTNPIEVEYRATGQEAQALFNLVHFNQPNGAFEFQNEEGTLNISISATETTIRYLE